MMGWILDKDHFWKMDCLVKEKERNVWNFKWKMSQKRENKNNKRIYAPALKKVGEWPELIWEATNKLWGALFSLE